MRAVNISFGQIATVDLIWPDLRDIAASKLCKLLFVDDEAAYTIFFCEVGVAYKTVLYKSENPEHRFPVGYDADANDRDLAEFEATYKANCNKSVEPLARRDQNGVPVVSPSFLYSSDQARLAGVQFTAGAGQPTVYDIHVTSQMLVQGGQFWMDGAAAGDYADFSVVDKDNTLGLHTLYGLPLGTPIELVKYVDAYPVPASSAALPVWRDEILMPTVATITAGLYLRCVFHSHGSTDVAVGLLYRWYVNAGA
jgi:hypothetical protein